MSDKFPRNNPFPDDEPFEDNNFGLEEEATPEIDPDVEAYSPYDDPEWANDEIDPFEEHSFGEEDAVYQDDVALDDSFYDPPAPLISDSDLEYRDDSGNDNNWFRENWWRLAIVTILVLLIIFLLARSCGSKKEETMPTLAPTPTHVLLPTYTPTPQTELLPPANNANAQNQPAANASGNTTNSPTPVPAAPTPAPASSTTGGKFTINQVVVVTGTDKDELSFRWGPGKNYARRTIIKDGTKLTVIGGPEKADGHVWWRLKAQDGMIGWAVEDYLVPAQ